jgi:hypothetical protein
MEHGEMTLTVLRQKKTRPSATLSITSFTWTAMGSNPGIRNERPVINCMSYDTVFQDY